MYYYQFTMEWFYYVLFYFFTFYINDYTSSLYCKPYMYFVFQKPYTLVPPPIIPPKNVVEVITKVINFASTMGIHPTELAPNLLMKSKNYKNVSPSVYYKLISRIVEMVDS